MKRLTDIIMKMSKTVKLNYQFNEIENTSAKLSRWHAKAIHACSHCRLNFLLIRRSNKSSAVAEMGDRLAMTWAEKWELLCPFLWGKLGFPSNNVAWAEAYLHTKWHLDLPTVWPQYTNVRQTDNGPIVQGDRYSSKKWYRRSL